MGTKVEPVGMFVKAPRPGAVKTRLGEDVGMENAAKFYAGCVAWLLHRLQNEGIRPVLFYDPPGADSRLRSLFGLPDEVKLVAQEGEDLGKRMLNAFRWFEEREIDSPLLIGSDSPDLPVDRIRQARRELMQSEVVLGPAEDGGYYLIGTREPYPELFEGMEWSHENVLDETLSRARESHLSTAQLEPWRDIDTLGDLVARI